MQDEGGHSKDVKRETAAQCGLSWNSTEDGLEMVTHTQQQVATGTWVEQAGMMTVSLISILCGDTSPLWGRNKGFFKKTLDTETNVLFVTVILQQI